MLFELGIQICDNLNLNLNPNPKPKLAVQPKLLSEAANQIKQPFKLAWIWNEKTSASAFGFWL